MMKNSIGIVTALLICLSPAMAGTPNYSGAIPVTALSDSTGAPITPANPLNVTSTGSGAAVTSGADGVSNTATGMQTYDRSTLFNGSTWDRQFTCTQSATVSVTAGNTTQVIALSGTTVTRICSFTLSMSAAGTASITSGTGMNCGTGTTPLTPAIPLATGTPWSQSAGIGATLRGGAGTEICVAAATGNVVGYINYAQF